MSQSPPCVVAVAGQGPFKHLCPWAIFGVLKLYILHSELVKQKIHFVILGLMEKVFITVILGLMEKSFMTIN